MRSAAGHVVSSGVAAAVDLHVVEVPVLEQHPETDRPAGSTASPTEAHPQVQLGPVTRAASTCASSAARSGASLGAPATTTARRTARSSAVRGRMTYTLETRLRLGSYPWTMDELERRLAANAPVAASLVGLPKEQALQRLRHHGLVIRLVDHDEMPGPILLTADLRGDRVTVHVRGGIVTEADVG